jgi:DNA-binding GntR family transcriptional regulator
VPVAAPGLAAAGAAAKAPVVQPIVGRQSLRERIAGSLRTAVVSGELAPGVVYSVPSLAAQFGISATPVREAMLELCRDRLVEPVRNKGFRVVEVTDRQLDQITELRALIEIPTVAAVAEIATAEQVAELAPLAEQICVSAAAGDLVGYLENDREFHLGLLAIGGNELLVEMVSRLRTQTRLYGLPTLEREHRLTRSAEEHLEILDALRRNDARLAEDVMRRHIGHVRSLWASRGED